MSGNDFDDSPVSSKQPLKFRIIGRGQDAENRMKLPAAKGRMSKVAYTPEGACVIVLGSEGDAFF
ncbi:hypothetical protein D3C75_1225210 [compost metagenome]